MKSKGIKVCADCPGKMPCPVNGSMIANTQKGFPCAIEYVHSISDKKLTSVNYVTVDCREQVDRWTKQCPKCGKMLSFDPEHFEPKLEG